MRLVNWNACDASYVAAGNDGHEATPLTCDLGMHCDPQDATAEHKDPSGLRWRYPEGESDD
jgi:hypothetical protein